MQPKRLLAYGDVEMDILLKTESNDPYGHDVKVNDLTFSPGGSAANCAAIAGSLGLPVTFLGSLGADAWADPLLKDFHNFGVETRYIRRAAGKTGTCVAVVDAAGERKFYSYRGVNESAPPDLPPDSVWQEHHCLHLSGYSFQQPNSADYAWNLIREAKKHSLTVSLDPSYLFAKYAQDVLADLLPQLDFFFPNREESAILSGTDDPLRAARVLRDKGIKVVVVTLGREGCLISGAGMEQGVRMVSPAPAIDTTGAGDAFCGGFLTGWLHDFSLVQSCKIGCAAAAHIVTKMGAHEQAPTMPDILSIMQQNHEDELAEFLFQKTLAGVIGKK